MACLELDSPQVFSTHHVFYDDTFSTQFGESISADILDVSEASTSSLRYDISAPYKNPEKIITNVPKPPPVPELSRLRNNVSNRLAGYCRVPIETRQVWDKLFEEGYEADVHVLTDDKDIILAHSTILAVASPVLRNFLIQEQLNGGFKCIKIAGAPSKAVRLFIRFLYSSCYRLDEMKKFVLHLLVLSHIFSVSPLKRLCTDLLEKELLDVDNVVDVLQLSRECDAPRLSLFCIRLIIRDFKIVSVTEGWKVMKRANPDLEQELLECLVEVDSRNQEKMKKTEERKVYMQLYEAMEALLHVCRDGCRSIGPRDKTLQGSQATCNFPACKGLESLVRHFSSCKTRVPGGCSHCKRMWQLLELHSWMCTQQYYSCKVPLCRQFKDKMPHRSKKDELKWKLLVSKVMASKGTIGSISARRSFEP